MKRDFKGIWIPKEIWLNEDLSIMEKLFLIEIDSLDNEEGCYASNEHFSNFFGLSKNRCTEIIKSLEKKGLISIELQREAGKKNISKRIIRVLGKSNRGYSENRTKGVRKTDEGYSENREENNTLSNNTIDNNIYCQIIDYLNEKANKNYRSNISKNQRLIKARIKENFTVEDFKKVIDIKVREWGKDEKMSKYLRPETLFGTKFESYLNEKEEKNAGSKDTGGNGSFEYSGFAVD